MLKFSRHCPICKNEDSFKFERTLNNYSLFKCKSCHFVFSDISDNEVLKVNSTFANEVDASYQENQTGIDKIWFRYFAKKVSKKLPNRGKLLDIGCGNGFLLSILKDFGWELYGNDLSPWAQKYADKYSYKVYNQSIETLNLKNEFDCIVSTSTFEHVINPLEHLSAIIEALKPGGFCWITIPNYGSLSIRLNISRFDFNQPPFHVNYFTPKSLKQLFKILQKKYSFNYGFHVYGIPELYSFYVFLNKLFNPFKSKKKQNSDKVNDIQQNEPVAKKQSHLKTLLYKSIVLINFYTGGIFRIGDRIEFFIQKK
jgi:2-polyprenyl-3-methyl-5-hydroxy-6-metoxy-1,4-benzoquinol methylase